jgi:diguanylate cyclase (GGDEF)-like protein
MGKNMLNSVVMDAINIAELQKELERTKTELNILYEVSNAMRTTLKLDEILYIILTGVTAHIGLGFNRAILLLVNESGEFIEGRMGIGPDSGEQANRIWKHIELKEMDLEELIDAFQTSNHMEESAFNKQVRNIRVSLKDQQSRSLINAVLEGIPLQLSKESMQKYLNDPIIRFLDSEELAVVPLKAKDKINGIILADNFITKKTITKNDLRMLIMLANQAGLAVENSRLFEKTVIRAHTDSLTDLWNHGYFQRLLGAEIERAKATDKPMSLIMLDIDDFKIYNDKLGHQAGDKILKNLAGLLRNQSRKMDYTCRYGGEEFTVILPHTDKKEAFFIAERLRENIEKYYFNHEEILPHKKLTVSLGIASFPVDGSTPSELIAASDKALYQAKHKGKNTAC